MNIFDDDDDDDRPHRARPEGKDAVNSCPTLHRM